MSSWEEMKAAVRRAAERELELKIDTKPINDIQIMGSPYGVRVEGTYLGWTSRERCDELRRLYAETPSRLRKGPEMPRPSLEEVAASIGMLAKVGRELEADMLLGGDRVRHGVMSLRRELELLHERVLTMEQEGRAVG